jgi:hypothetical protein
VLGEFRKVSRAWGRAVSSAVGSSGRGKLRTENEGVVSYGQVIPGGGVHGYDELRQPSGRLLPPGSHYSWRPVEKMAPKYIDR